MRANRFPARLAPWLAFVLLAPAAGGQDVLTHRYDSARSGVNAREALLAPANVQARTFGLLHRREVDGFVYAQPLYARDVSLNGRSRRNVVFVATQHGSVYAFDADTNDNEAAAPLWVARLVNPAAGLLPFEFADLALFDPPATELCLTGTPVIDRDSGTLYVVTKTKDISESPVRYQQHLHALDLGSGEPRPGSPVEIQASVPGSGLGADSYGRLAFDPLYQLQRAGLALGGGLVWIAFGTQGGIGPSHGWILGYDAQTLQRVHAFCTTPDGVGGGLWMSGVAPAVDTDGHLFCVSGNGPFDAHRGGRNYSDSLLKLGVRDGEFGVRGHFTPPNQAYLEAHDADFGSGGALLLPAAATGPGRPRLAVAAGKDGTLYLVDRDAPGGFVAQPGGAAWQSITLGSSLFGLPTWHAGRLFVHPVGAPLRSYRLENGQLSGLPVSTAPHRFGYPGSIPVVSSWNDENGIVWALRTDGFRASAPAVLYAYDARDLSRELYHTGQAGARDQLGPAQKFAVPTVANGRVYVATARGLDVLGLLPGVPAEVRLSLDGDGQLSLSGEPGVAYRIETGDHPTLASSWTRWMEVRLARSTQRLGPVVPSGTARFYRAVRLDP